MAITGLARAARAEGWVPPYYEHRQAPSASAGIGGRLIRPTPGNRLYESADGRVVELAQHSFPFVVGRIIGPFLWRSGRILASLAGRVSRMLPGGHSRTKPSSAASDCYGNITTKYPGMDGKSRSLVQGLCDNVEPTLALRYTTLDEPEVQGVCEALQQNTALTDLTFSSVYCDTPFFASALKGALMANRHLKHLALEIGDTEPSNIYPTPVKEQAVITLMQSAPCFNLTDFDLGAVDLTVEVAEAVAGTLQAPMSLRGLDFTWHDNGQSVDQQLALVFDGIRSNQCITTLGLGVRTGLKTAQRAVSLFAALPANNTVSILRMWCAEPFSLSLAQVAIIVGSVANATCFLGTVDLANPCFPPPVATAIRNATQGRTACSPNPRCVPRDCSTGAPTSAPSRAPSAAPSSQPSSAPSGAPSSEPTPAPSAEAAAAGVVTVQQPLAIGLGLGVGGGFIGAALLAFFKCRVRQHQAAGALEEENKETVQLEQLEQVEGGGQRICKQNLARVRTVSALMLGPQSVRQSSGFALVPLRLAAAQLPAGRVSPAVVDEAAMEAQGVAANEEVPPAPQPSPAMADRGVGVGQEAPPVLDRGRALAEEVSQPQREMVDRGVSPVQEEPAAARSRAPSEEQDWTLDLGEGPEEAAQPPVPPRAPGEQGPEDTGEL